MFKKICLGVIRFEIGQSELEILTCWNLLTLGASLSQEGRETFFFASQVFIILIPNPKHKWLSWNNFCMDLANDKPSWTFCVMLATIWTHKSFQNQKLTILIFSTILNHPDHHCALQTTVVPPSAMQVFHPKGAYLLGPILMKDLVVHSIVTNKEPRPYPHS